jgi:tetratricopeptide (TPR) repeat protein
MRDIVVLFKGVGERPLSDPGEELRKVLAFKRTLEEQKSLLYGTFDSLEEFERDLRRHLLRWMRVLEGEGDGAPQDAPPPPSDSAEQAAVFSSATTPEIGESSALVALADQYVDEGRLAEAESMFAKAVAARTDVEAMTKYTRFLRRTGRSDLAQAMSERLIEVGRELNDPHAEIEGLSNIAIIERNEGDLDKALLFLKNAVKIAKRLDGDGVSELAFLYDNVGLTLRKQGKVEAALDEFQRALEIRRDLNDPRGLASTFNNIGVSLRQMGDLEKAELKHREALKIFIDLGYRRGQAISRSYLGEVLEASDRFEDAKAEYLTELELDRALNSPKGVSMNLCQLSRVALRMGDIESATDYAHEALDAGESTGDRQGIANSLHMFARLDLHNGDNEDALEYLEASLDIYRDLEQQDEIAWTLADKAFVLCRLGRVAEARSSLDAAAAEAASLFNSGLDTHIETVSSEFPA